MPVHVGADIRRLGQQEFGRVAYDVMEHVFAVHNEMGRFFDEEIYRNAIASRAARSQTEVLVEVRLEAYRKPYYIDLLVDGGAVFELKAIRALGAPQRAQLLNDLLLAAPGWAFRVTAVDDSSFSGCEDHARRWLGHTTLEGLHWINVTRDCVAFTTIEK